MKKLLLVIPFLLFLPKVHAVCTVTITPPNFTLQTSHTQTFSVTGSGCTGTLGWTLSCTPSSHCSNGNLNSTTSTSVTFTAPSSPSGISTAEVVTLKATYSGAGGGNASAPVTITAVQMNSLLNYLSADNTDFQNNVIANSSVSGVNVLMDWASIESSNAGGTGSGGYNFSAFDSAIASLFTLSGQGSPSYTKKINIIVQGVTGGCAIGNTATCGNTSTPNYVFSQGWATANGATNPLDVFYGCGYGIAQTIPPTVPPPGFPAVYEVPFTVAYENFIKKVLTRYSTGGASSLAPYIGYIRFGLSAGGEVYPFCQSGNYTQTQWLNYVSSIDSFETGLTPAPTMQLMTSINQTYFPSNFTYPDTEAQDAAGDSIGFGSQGLQQGDIVSLPCAQDSTTSDWCYLFNGSYGNSVPLELQTTLLSDPIFQSGDKITAGTPSQTGSLKQLIPFATANRAQIFELYAYDMLYAFDSNYCALSGATQAYCSGSNRKYPSCYSTVIQNAENGVSQSSGYCP